jgi:hypothetical protein
MHADLIWMAGLLQEDVSGAAAGEEERVLLTCKQMCKQKVEPVVVGRGVTVLGCAIGKTVHAGSCWGGFIYDAPVPNISL